MKAVLMSIQPKWCGLIANGEKTVEVRKTKPKLETPFKVYIYCTLPPKSEFFWHHNEEGRRTIGEYAHELIRLPNGQVVYDYGMRLACEEGEYTQDNFLCRKVIGEFVCDKIDYWTYYWQPDVMHIIDMSKLSCVSVDELLKYSNNGKDTLYGWHISDLVIYDKPKELWEFQKYPRKLPFDALTRPPQSWCYVERHGDNYVP